MTGTAIAALAADREALLVICAGLGDAEWKTDSGCPGWSVQDVVAHVGALFWAVVDPSVLPDVGDLPTERAQARYVEDRRSWSADQVLADYESVSLRALDSLAALAEQDFEVPLGDLGTYPASILPNAFSFDHFVHIRADLFAPRGPLTSDPPPSDELRVGAALDWIDAALPQQNADAIAALTGSVEIELTGPGARAVRLGDGTPTAHIRSESVSFVRWVTQRASWDDCAVVATGDDRDLAVARSLHVF